MDPKKISIRDYNYTLPEEKIAKYPLPKRDESKLLVYQDGKITEDNYRNIADHLPDHALLIFNDTRVVEARILFQKSSGGIIEIYCLEPAGEIRETNHALMQKEKVLWKCLIGGASKWKKGQLLKKTVQSKEVTIDVTARFVEKKGDHFIIEMSWVPRELSFSEILHLVGQIPLPPYIKRKAVAEDNVRYQTIYARQDGSVAAPTAGLHFTDHIFEECKKKNILSSRITLHVGAGTFMPVKSETLADHTMHEECIELMGIVLESIIRSIDSPIIPVGTTSLRTLESLYWLGIKTMADPEISPALLQLHQWEPYSLAHRNIHPREALVSLAEWTKKYHQDPFITTTSLIIVPGYELKIASGIITNFHQPVSTLLLLVAAIVGEDWKKIYQHALENGFRFLSYGDGSLLFSAR
jgi:S-adenosylmethionine:tRNA ribosyltransferase-isomerase